MAINIATLIKQHFYLIPVLLFVLLLTTINVFTINNHHYLAQKDPTDIIAQNEFDYIMLTDLLFIVLANLGQIALPFGLFVLITVVYYRHPIIPALKQLAHHTKSHYLSSPYDIALIIIHAFLTTAAMHLVLYIASFDSVSMLSFITLFLSFGTLITNLLYAVFKAPHGTQSASDVILNLTNRKRFYTAIATIALAALFPLAIQYTKPVTTHRPNPLGGFPALHSPSTHSMLYQDFTLSLLFITIFTIVYIAIEYILPYLIYPKLQLFSFYNNNQYHHAPVELLDSMPLNNHNSDLIVPSHAFSTLSLDIHDNTIFMANNNILAFSHPLSTQTTNQFTRSSFNNSFAFFTHPLFFLSAGVSLIGNLISLGYIQSTSPVKLFEVARLQFRTTDQISLSITLFALLTLCHVPFIYAGIAIFSHKIKFTMIIMSSLAFFVSTLVYNASMGISCYDIFYLIPIILIFVSGLILIQENQLFAKSSSASVTSSSSLVFYSHLNSSAENVTTGTSDSDVEAHDNQVIKKTKITLTSNTNLSSSESSIPLPSNISHHHYTGNLTDFDFDDIISDGEF